MMFLLQQPEMTKTICKRNAYINVPKDRYKHVHSSLVRNFLKLETTQAPINSKTDKLQHIQILYSNEDEIQAHLTICINYTNRMLSKRSQNQRGCAMLLHLYKV